MSRVQRYPKRILIIVVFLIISLVAFLFIYDRVAGRRSVPAWGRAPAVFCHAGWSAITLPPLGVFVCPEYAQNEPVQSHELVHWDQYRRYGIVGFYARYIAGWVQAGFSYKNNWMEVEARERAR